MNAPVRHRDRGQRPVGAGAGVVLKRRCAVYTRKSSEEGLEQEFNSLDAQREACEAYVLSQRQEGWILVPDHYDDGGFSGGTLDRPALQRLLADGTLDGDEQTVAGPDTKVSHPALVVFFDNSFVVTWSQFHGRSPIGHVLAQRFIAAGVVPVEVRIDDALKRAFVERLKRVRDRRRHVVELRIDDEESVLARRHANIPATPLEHVNLAGDWMSLDVDRRWLLLGRCNS